MTDYEQKLFKLEKLNAEVDTYESVDGYLVIQWFINDYVFNEYIYTKQGKFIEKHTIHVYPPI